MSIYDIISKMMGHESEAEKLYKVLNTDEYKKRPYEYSDLGEGEWALLGKRCGDGTNTDFSSITIRNVPTSL